MKGGTDAASYFKCLFDKFGIHINPLIEGKRKKTSWKQNDNKKEINTLMVKKIIILLKKLNKSHNNNKLNYTEKLLQYSL